MRPFYVLNQLSIIMSELRNNITGVILAGGKSSRIGTEKALLKINGVSLIERAISFCKIFFPKLLISTNDIEKFEFTDIECINDVYPNLGPISGIHSGLIAAITDKIFIMSVDIVFDEPRLIETLIEYKTQKLITIPVVDEIPQYVFGIYSRNVLSIVEEQISKNKMYSPKKLIKDVDTELIDFSNIDFFISNRFLNINTLEEFERAKKVFGKT